jgi:hypothetical protein
MSDHGAQAPDDGDASTDHEDLGLNIMDVDTTLDRFFQLPDAGFDGLYSDDPFGE